MKNFIELYPEKLRKKCAKCTKEKRNYGEKPVLNINTQIRQGNVQGLEYCFNSINLNQLNMNFQQPRGNQAIQPSTMIMEEQIDENYIPSNEEVLEYAQYLGMDLVEDKDLFYIAKEGLKAPLPDPWKPCKAPDGDIYYFNFESGESIWEHPCDEYYRKLYIQEKANKRQKIEKKKVQTQQKNKSIGEPVLPGVGGHFLNIGQEMTEKMLIEMEEMENDFEDQIDEYERVKLNELKIIEDQLDDEREAEEDDLNDSFDRKCDLKKEDLKIKVQKEEKKIKDKSVNGKLKKEEARRKKTSERLRKEEKTIIENIQIERDELRQELIEERDININKIKQDMKLQQQQEIQRKDNKTKQEQKKIDILQEQLKLKEKTIRKQYEDDNQIEIEEYTQQIQEKQYEQQIKIQEGFAEKIREEERKQQQINVGNGEDKLRMQIDMETRDKEQILEDKQIQRVKDYDKQSQQRVIREDNDNIDEIRLKGQLQLSRQKRDYEDNHKRNVVPLNDVKERLQQIKQQIQNKQNELQDIQYIPLNNRQLDDKDQQLQQLRQDIREQRNRQPNEMTELHKDIREVKQLLLMNLKKGTQKQQQPLYDEGLIRNIEEINIFVDQEQLNIQQKKKQLYNDFTLMKTLKNNLDKNRFTWKEEVINQTISSARRITLNDIKKKLENQNDVLGHERENVKDKINNVTRREDRINRLKQNIQIWESSGQSEHTRDGNIHRDILQEYHNYKKVYVIQKSFNPSLNPSFDIKLGFEEEVFQERQQIHFTRQNSQVFSLYQRDIMKMQRNRDKMKSIMYEQSSWMSMMKSEISKSFTRTAF